WHLALEVELTGRRWQRRQLAKQASHSARGSVATHGSGAHTNEHGARRSSASCQAKRKPPGSWCGWQLLLLETPIDTTKGAAKMLLPATLHEKMREVRNAASEQIEAPPPPLNAIEGPNGNRFPLLVDFKDRPISVSVWGHERYRQGEQVWVVLLQPGQQLAR